MTIKLLLKKIQDESQVDDIDYYMILKFPLEFVNEHCNKSFPNDMDYIINIAKEMCLQLQFCENK